MADDNKRRNIGGAGGGGGAVYFFGLIGAAVYYIQQAHGFWPVIVALLKAIVWPSFLAYDLLKFIK